MTVGNNHSHLVFDRHVKALAGGPQIKSQEGKLRLLQFQAADLPNPFRHPDGHFKKQRVFSPQFLQIPILDLL